MTLPLVAYYTSRMGFLIQAGSDQASYEDIVNALLKTDGASGLILCANYAARPTTNRFPGMYIKTIDDGKHYYLDSTGSWASGVYSGGVWIEDTYVTILTLSGSQGNVIFGSRASLQYAVGVTGGVTGGALADVVANTTIDLNIPVAFGLTATTNVVVDLDVYCYGIAGNTFNATKAATRSLDASNDADLEFHLYDGATDLGVIGRSYPSADTTSASVPRQVQVATKNLFSLLSGSHTLALKVITRTRTQQGVSSVVQLIEPRLTVTVSGA